MLGPVDLNGSIRIDAPVERVFAFVDDWTNTTRFLRNLVRWEPLDSAVVRGVGARFRAALKAGPITLDGEMEITEHVPNERVQFRSTKGPRLSGTWTFRPDGDGTIVDLRNTFELPGGIAGRVVGQVARSQGQKDLNGSLVDLKKLVEA